MGRKDGGGRSLTSIAFHCVFYVMDPSYLAYCSYLVFCLFVRHGRRRGGGGERGWSVWELVQIKFLRIGGNPTRKSTHTSRRQRHRPSPLSFLRSTPPQLSQLRSSAIAPVRLRLSSPPQPSHTPTRSLFPDHPSVCPSFPADLFDGSRLCWRKRGGEP